MIDEKQFFDDVIDPNFPGMKEAVEAYRQGKIEEAEHLFRTATASFLDAKKYFSTEPEPVWDEERVGGAIPAAEAACRFYVGACGFLHQYEPYRMDWSLNPTPNNYGEYVWQINRCYIHQTLAHAYQIQPEKKYAEIFAYYIESWLDQNVVPLAMVNRGCTSYDHVAWRFIESGIRMSGAFPYFIHVFKDVPEVSDHLFVRIFMSVWEHGYMLHHYNSSHNWLLMEMTGLFHIGTLYPFFKTAGQWKKYAEDRMVEELSVQIYPEGFQYELSTGYHIGAIEEYTRLMRLSKVYGQKTDDRMLEAVHRMYKNHVHLLMPNREVPGLGDASDFDYLPHLETALKYYPKDETFRWLVSGGKEGREPEFLSAVLPTVGHCVMRTSWDKDAIWLHFDSAHYGWGHAHEDKLAVNLCAYGKKLLHDAGNYEYDRSSMRQMVVSTRGHNTAMVDACDQSREVTFSQRYAERTVLEKIPSDLGWNFGEEYEVAEGTYDAGYGAYAAVRVEHHRKVIFFKRGLPGTKPFFVILDRFTPQDNGEHLYESMFRFDLAQSYEAEGKTAIGGFGDGVTLFLIASAPVVTVKGQDEPRYIGWAPLSAPGTDHVHTPVPVALVTERGGKTSIATVLYPNDAAECPVDAVTAKGSAFAIALKDGKTYAFDADTATFATTDAEGKPFTHKPTNP